MDPLLVAEWTAVALNLGFTLGIAWGRKWGWVLGFIASLISVWLYADTQTWAMTGLNVFYAFMAIYGWITWGRSRNEGRIIRWNWMGHVLAISAILITTQLLAWLLRDQLNGTLPGLDAFITVFSFVATWMMAHRVLENWVYWTVGDLVAVYFNWMIGYEGFALLNATYIVLSLIGLVKWWRKWKDQAPVMPTGVG